MPESEVQTDPPHQSPRGDLRDGYVFISYKREEVELADRIRNALVAAGFSVWWDADIQCGQAWNEVLDDAVKQAGCVVVLWSKKAMESRWVMHEASRAMDREVYAPVRIELCPIESPYDRLQATDIVEWDGSTRHPGVDDLLQRVNSLLPVRKPLHVRATEWCWSNFTTIATALFAILALGILSWQTVATRLQMSRMNDVVARQSESARTLQDVLTQQTQAAKSATEREERQRRQRESELLAAIERNAGVLAEINRTLYAIDDVEMYFRADIRLDDPQLSAYKKRIEAEIRDLPRKFKTDRPFDLAHSYDPTGELTSVTISHDHPLFPQPSNDGEQRAYQMVTGATLVCEIYKNAIPFAEHPFWDIRGKALVESRRT